MKCIVHNFHISSCLVNFFTSIGGSQGGFCRSGGLLVKTFELVHGSVGVDNITGCGRMVTHLRPSVSFLPPCWSSLLEKETFSLSYLYMAGKQP